MKIYHRLILVMFLSIAASQNSPYTIQSLPAYSLQRSCVQACFAGYGNVPSAIGCPVPNLNACVCRTDLQTSASTFLTSCVNQGCNTNAPDLSSAVEMYDSYCSMNGYPIVGAVVTTTAATSFVTSPTTATVIIVPTATVTATATSILTSLASTLSSVESPLSSSSTSTSSSTKTSTLTTTSISSTTIPISTPISTPAASINAGAIAGGVVGGIAAIGIIVAMIFFFLRRSRKPSPDPLPDTIQYGDQLQPNIYNPLNTASPSPPYVQNTAPYPDAKNGKEIYEAAASGPTSPAEHTYGASGENWNA